MCAYRLFKSVKRPFQSSRWKKNIYHFNLDSIFLVCCFLPLMRQYRILLCCDSFKDCRWNHFVLFLHTLTVFLLSYSILFSKSYWQYNCASCTHKLVCSGRPGTILLHPSCRIYSECLWSWSPWQSWNKSYRMHFWGKGNWNICLEAVCLCSSWSSNMQLVECNWNNGL